MPNLVIVTGPQAVGKMTVAECLKERTGYNLMVNHDSIEASDKIFGVATPEQKEFNGLIREAAFDTAIKYNKDFFCRYSDVYRDNPDDDKIDCELCAIYVDWEIRGNGVGSAIVEFVKNYFKSIGKHTMILWCLRENMSARAFYEKMGGKEEGLKSFERGGKTYQEVGYIYNL